MKRSANPGLLRTIAIAGVLLLACGVALAQGHGPGGGGPPGGGGGGAPGGGSPGGGFGGGGFGMMPAPNNSRENVERPNNVSRSPGSNSGGSGLQLGPPGRWWDDKKFAQGLGLRPQQQKKMDAVFNANKGAIFERYDALQREQSRMEDLTSQKPLQEQAIFAQVDRVAQARAALEKANAHLLLLLRQEMDADQIARLEEKH